MDRNQATGLIIIALLLIVYFQFLAPKPEPHEPATEPEIIQTTPPEQEEESAESIIAETDTAQITPGVLGITTSEVPQLIEVENEDVRFKFNTRGGIPSEILLKEFLTHTKEPLYLIDETSSSQSFNVNIDGEIVDLFDQVYQVDRSRRGDSIRLLFTLPLAGAQAVVQEYMIPPQGYEVKYSIQLRGMQARIRNSNVVLSWRNQMKKLDKDVGFYIRGRSAAVNYYGTDGEFDDLRLDSDESGEEKLEKPLKWIGFKQAFFNSSIIADRQFSQAYITYLATDPEGGSYNNIVTDIAIPVEHVNQGKAAGFTYYFGPNNYQILKKITPGFSKNVYLGYPVINAVNKYLIIPIFNLLENYIGSYGIIIIILVLIIKTLLFPLSYKSYVSMAKTRVLKPELDSIKEKHKGDMQTYQQEQMKLYQQVGVNPLSGCIPLLFQMPILFAMFFFFPNSIELRQEAFLWSSDLSTYDSVLNLPFNIPMYGSHVSLFTLLMTISTILYTWSNNQASSVTGPMKSITYIMPLFFMLILNSYPSGLSFYYFVTNIVSFGQQAIIRKFVDDEKIKSILDENRKKNKNKKKSKFQLRLEEAMKAKEENKKKR